MNNVLGDCGNSNLPNLVKIHSLYSEPNLKEGSYLATFQILVKMLTIVLSVGNGGYGRCLSLGPSLFGIAKRVVEGWNHIHPAKSQRLRDNKRVAADSSARCDHALCVRALGVPAARCDLQQASCLSASPRSQLLPHYKYNPKAKSSISQPARPHIAASSIQAVALVQLLLCPFDNAANFNCSRS